MVQLFPTLLSHRDFVREERLAVHLQARLVHMYPTLETLEVLEV